MLNERDAGALIGIISEASDRYVDKLIAFMDRYGLGCLADATTEQLTAFIEAEHLLKERGFRNDSKQKPPIPARRQMHAEGCGRAYSGTARTRFEGWFDDGGHGAPHDAEGVDGGKLTKGAIQYVKVFDRRFALHTLEHSAKQKPRNNGGGDRLGVIP